jgi:hypothetical protein
VSWALRRKRGSGPSKPRGRHGHRSPETTKAPATPASAETSRSSAARVLLEEEVTERALIRTIERAYQVTSCSQRQRPPPRGARPGS